MIVTIDLISMRWLKMVGNILTGRW